jgi:D-serine dehydratase
MATGLRPAISPTVDWRFKGFPMDRGAEIRARDLPDQGWNVRRGDLLLPLMMLKRSALTHNIATMAEYCRAHGVELAPHAKTSMAPALLREQLEAGAWGFTVANTSQAIVLRALGFNRLLLASQMVEPRAVQWAAEQLRDPEFDLLVLVDSLDAVTIMDTTLREIGGVRPLRVLVELGQWGGRTGCRTPDQVESLIKAIQATETLQIAGIEGFEGLIPADSPDDVLVAVNEYLAGLRALIERLARGGAFDHLDSIVVSAGGSAYFDLVGRHLTGFEIGRPVQTILRSGCYVTHDHEMYELTSPLAARGAPDPATRLVPAFEVWGAVWSRPEPTLAVVGMGKRDAATDYLLPHPLRVIAFDGTERPVLGQLRVAQFNDQHAYVEVPAEDPIRPGDRVVFGISHPCAAFDKWRLIPVVDDDYTVIDAIETYF